jgi:D-3-phosphoglycerate dehydrogenase / 2-oxoglutarate reductase
MLDLHLGRVLVAEPFDERGIELLQRAGADVVSCVGASRDTLQKELHGARGLIVRSETRVDRELLSSGPQLEVVARAGVGTDAIDIEAASAAGIVVVNTPSANTIATTEHTFALLLASLRHVAQAHAMLRARRWERKEFVGHELYGKTLGIVGLGRIGESVAVRGAAFGMQVVAHDPYAPASRASALGVELLDLDALLVRADVVTLHVPQTPQTRTIVDARALALMRDDAVLVNCARGALVDLDALLATLEAGRLRAVALDVLPEEPPPAGSASARILEHPRVLATPHLGGSTFEAMERIALDLAQDVVRVLSGRPASGAVNSPVSGATPSRFVDLAFALGTMLPQLFEGALREELAILLQGELADLEPEPFAAAVLAGALPVFTDRRVTMVNATAIARELGLRTTVQREGAKAPFRASFGVAAGEHRVIGTVLANGVRVVEIDGFEIDAIAEGTMLLTRHNDIPGMVGKIGTILGNADVNISTMQVARRERGGGAMRVLGVDRRVDRGVLVAIAEVSGVESVRSIEL